MADGKFKISKISAARRQLDCAVELWFRDGDMVSIHTLVFAAYEIFNDLNKKHGNIEATLLGHAQSIARPGHLEDLMRIFKAPMNFFKHANRDPHEILEFDPVINEFLILFAIKGLDALGEQVSDMHNAFSYWLVLHKPYLMKEGATNPFQPFTSQQIESIKTLSKREFLDAFLRGCALRRT